MAAEYGININVKTSQVGLNKLITNLKALDNELKKTQEKIRNDSKLKDLNRQKNRALADEKSRLLNGILKLNTGFLNSSNVINKSFSSLKLLSNQMRDARSQTKFMSGEFKVLSQIIQKSDFTTQFRALKRFSEMSAFTAKNFAGNIQFGKFEGISDALTFKPANTTNAINEYIRFLKLLEGQLERTGQEFKDVTFRIKEMENELRSPVINPTANQTSKPAGPRQAMAGENFFNRTFSGNRQFQQGGMFFEPGGFASRRRNALSSGLIGGGFPLLFGQGIGASVGGGIGGIAGGFLGGGLGFGLSIVGTQLGKQVDVLVQATKKTGDALGDLTKDANVLVEALGNTNNAFGQRVKLLEQAKGKQAAFAEAVKQTISVVGEQGVFALKSYGNETKEIQTSLTQVFLQFQAGLARVNQFLGITKALADLLPRNLTGELKGILSDPNVGNFGGVTGSRTGLNAKQLAETIRKIENPKGFQELMFSEMNKGNLSNLKQDAKDLINLGNQIINNTIAQEFFNREKEHELELINAVGFSAREDIRLRKKVNDEIRAYEELVNRPARENEIEKIQRLVEATSGLALGMRLVNDEIEKLDIEMIQLNDTGFQLVELSKSISSSFEESFKGVIRGTMTVQDAFRNMLNKIADHFLDTAAKMAANQIQRSILGMFGQSLFKGVSNNIFDNQNVNSVIDNSFDTPKLADGGMAKAGRSHLVGERGPELFTPGVSGMVTPNHALGGSTNVVVNVDASGSNVEGDEQGGRELGRLISAAVQSEIVQQQRPGGLLT